jgi:hypothetical protein
MFTITFINEGNVHNLTIIIGFSFGRLTNVIIMNHEIKRNMKVFSILKMDLKMAFIPTSFGVKGYIFLPFFTMVDDS